MRALAFLALTLIAPAVAKDADFNGRWNIHVETNRGRAWWLEVNGAGTAKLSGSFVGAPGGQVDAIPEISIKGGELVFVFRRQTVVQTYRARLKGEQLIGTMEAVTGSEKAEPLPWTGVRAPKIADREDASWKLGKPVDLFNGKDVSGWRLQVKGRPGWLVKDGILINEPKASDIVSEAKFWNFELMAEYRYDKGSNSGIALRGRYEIQIFDNFGQPADVHGNGALYSRIPPATNASKPAGEWQRMEVRLVGRTLTVKLNGTTVIDKQEVVGATAMTVDANEEEPGPIVLQGDHGVVEFRKLQVIPLTR